MIIKRKLFTKYDDADNLKRMKDSDILAEKPKSAPGFANTAGATLGGAAIGGTLGAIGGAFKKNTIANGSNAASVGVAGGSKAAPGFFKRMYKGGKKGMILGGLVAGGIALHNRNKQVEENEWYNNRLEYAQRQARRREKKDWKTNMSQRDGYSY